MTILVIDKLDNRKKALEAELHRAGWLVTSSNWSNQAELVALVDSCQIVIVLDSDLLVDWEQPVWATALNRVVMIGKLPVGLDKAKVREVVECHPHPQDSLDHFISAIVKQVSFISYKHFFPITANNQMKNTLNQARKSALSSAPVLILGETGVGKEVIAQYVHFHSKHAEGPFVAVNCAAIPETMIEAVLFGYEKGAFTNAINHHVGKFEKANNGTIFLDEIGEMSIDLQAKLLRVLQNSEIERLGGKDVIKVNVRIIAATNKNLIKQVELGLFRPDLYYRVNVIQLKCIPLRERREDIVALSNYFVKLYSQDINVDTQLTDGAMTKLISYDWPGNVRELQNVINRSVVMSDTALVTENDICFDSESNNSKISYMVESSSLKMTEAEAIVKVLKETNGCRTDAAKLLMISPRTLRHKISKLKEVGFDVP